MNKGKKNPPQPPLKNPSDFQVINLMLKIMLSRNIYGKHS